MKTREQVLSLLEEKYAGMFLRTTEEFNGSQGGIWTSGEDYDIKAKDGFQLFDYWSEDHKRYTLGVHNEIYNLLDKIGWYCEWNDAGTIMIWQN